MARRRISDDQPTLEAFWADPDPERVASAAESPTPEPSAPSAPDPAADTPPTPDPETLLDFTPLPDTSPAAGDSAGITPTPAPVGDAPSFRIADQGQLAPRTPTARFDANVAALTVLGRLRDEQRPATPVEQAVLARWSSWGASGLAQMLDDAHPEHEARRETLRALLPEDAYAAARRTTINAHYTDAALVHAIWQAMEDLGFEGGRVLEPGCGAGTFIGAAPSTAQLTGIELDPTSAAIAAALYPDATVRAESFADTRYPGGHFDAAIGNVPFADVTLHDPRYNSARLPMHNHFIVKSLELTRPGGMVALLTSRYTMDATTPTARREINARADLVAAIRLPSGAHQRAAGTDAVTDLLILRRRAPGQTPLSTSWETTVDVEMDGPQGPETTRINQYWLDHPAHVLGTQTLAVGLHGVLGVAVLGDPEQAPEQLREQLQQVTHAARARGLVFEPRAPETERQPAGIIAAAKDAIDGQISAHPDGTFTIVEEGLQIPLLVPRTHAAEVRALIGLRDQARALIGAEAADLDDSPQLDAQRRTLMDDWRSYVDKHGPINRVTLRRTGRTDPDSGDEIMARVTPPAVRIMRKDPYAALLWGLEVFDELTGTAEPADLLRHRIVVPRQPVRGVDNARDGLAVVLDTVGRIDLDEIANLLGHDVARVVDELGDAVFQVPGTDQWQTRAEYLSGDVRSKLVTAREANVEDPGRWQHNVDALAAVLPADLQAGDLVPRFGAVWIPPADVETFLRELLGVHRVRVDHVEGVSWSVEGADWGVAATEEWGTSRLSAGQIVEHLARQKPIAIFDTNEDKSRIYNPTASAAAIEKGRLLQERFASWVWEDPERTDRLLAEYNRRFNSLVIRDYTSDGQYLTLPGLARSFTPHAHQRAAVARMINEPSVGLFHEVGAGKTAEMVMGLTELKRLGLVSKPAVIVPNHMLEQFSREWIQLYPQARILAASTDDLTADRRRQFVGRVAAHDWDAVVMTRSAFERLPLDPENEAAFQAAETADAMERVSKARANNPTSRGLKAMERALLRTQEKIKERRDMPADPGLTFEETGIDYLCVDELHGYKNLTTSSEIPDVNIAGSKRASDLHAKVSYLRSRNGARVLCGATATPIANSIAEMHVMQRYLDPEGLQRAGVASFDAWAATFGEIVTAPEVTVAGGTRLKIKSRFARFNNLPELRAMFSVFADVKTAADLNLPRPLVATNSDGERAANVLLVPPTHELKSYMADIQARAERVDARAVRPEDDNMLKIGSDGRKAALDLRLSDPTYGHVPGTKLDVAADELHRIWQQHRTISYVDPATGEPSVHRGALQIVFCDLGTPNDSWNVYDELRDQLVARGMDRTRIRFIHDARNDTDKERLFAACRSGAVDVIIGSTEKMGTGTNIQARAIHLLNLDAPWRPADLQQRIGRALRQGNQNPEVIITHVVAEASFDTFMWQGLARKQNFIDQVMSTRGTARSVEGDIGDGVMPSNYTEIMASASGNPLIFELATARQELTRLSRLERAHHDSQRSLQQRKRQAEAVQESLMATIPELEDAIARTIPTAGDAFRLDTLNGRSIRSREDAAHALNTTIRLTGQDQPVCRLGGHTILGRVSVDYDRNYTVTWTLDRVPDMRATRLVKAGDTFAFTSGVIIQLENLVERIPKRLTEAQVHLEETRTTIQASTRLIGSPFPHGEDLAAAQDRVQLVTGMLEATQGQEPIDLPTAHRTAGAELVAQHASATMLGAEQRATLREIAERYQEPSSPQRAPATSIDEEPRRRGDHAR